MSQNFKDLNFLCLYFRQFKLRQIDFKYSYHFASGSNLMVSGIKILIDGINGALHYLSAEAFALVDSKSKLFSMKLLFCQIIHCFKKIILISARNGNVVGVAHHHKSLFAVVFFNVQQVDNVRIVYPKKAS